MVGEAETSNLTPLQPQNSSLQTRRRSGGVVTVDYFPVGSAVEVRTDEEGFKFVYFTATVISHTPASKSPKKSSRKKSSKKSGKDKSTCLDVEYHNLLAHDDGSDRLRETVDISFVRPVPPLQEIVKGFELGDSVDAFYKDGWWHGFVSEVKEGGERFIVTFQDPPDWIDFGPEDLRFHWEWVNGSWVRPQKQNMTGLMFEVGRKVEVSFNREDSQDAWFPASIDEDLGNGIFRVEYMDKKGEAVKTTVDSHHVRPCPPLLKDKNFVLLEKVDAYFDYCWWSGVITKELESSRYIVFFKPMKQDREINQSKLRPHMEWKDGKWFTSSQEASLQSSDDGVHEHHNSENSGATAAAAPVRNSVDARDSSDGKTPTSLTSTKGHVEQLTPDNQKMSHMTTSLKKRRHLTDSGTSHSQPPKKQKEGNAVATKSQDRNVGDGLICGFVSPDSASNADTSVIETTEDQTSFDHSWDKQIRKQRNIRSKQNSSGMITPTSSSMKNSIPTLFDSRSLDIRGEVLGAAENYLEEGQNEHGNEGHVVPIIIGLPCFETGSPGISGGKKMQTFKIKEVASLVSDHESPLISSSIQNPKDKTQSGIRESGERRKRGRPKRALVESTQAPVSGNAQNGDTGSGGLQRISEVVVFEAEAMMSDPKRSEGNTDKVADGLPYLKNKRVRTMKRTSPSLLHKEKGTKESIELGENLLSKKKGSKKAAVQVEDFLDASGGTVVEVDHTIEEQRIVEQPSAEFDNEPLSKWIVELNSPPMNDSSGRSPEGTLIPCRVNGERQRDTVVIDEAGETQLGSGIHPSVLVVKNPTVPSEPQSLPVVQKTVGIMLDLNIENQPETEPQAPVLADKSFTKPRDNAQSMPFVKTISLWKTIESMDTFQKIPQKPHFQPLEQVEESSYRESLAIGLMVTFASMVDATSKLQVTDPKSIVDEMIETVEKLDKHGFDVGVLQDHITEFLEVKDKEEMLVGTLANLNDQIGHCNHESTRIEEEMREINEQISQLQEKHSAAESAKEKMTEDVASLKALLEKTEDNIVNLRRSFKGGVSNNAP